MNKEVTSKYGVNSNNSIKQMSNIVNTEKEQSKEVTELLMTLEEDKKYHEKKERELLKRNGTI